MEEGKTTKMIKAVLLDMDGTIFDTEWLYARTLSQAGKEMGVDIDFEAEYLDIAGKSLEKIYAMVRERHGKDVPIEEIFERRWAFVDVELNRTGLPPKKGFPEVLGAFSKMGLSLAVASSSPRERIERYLSISGYASYIDLIVSCDEVREGKPSPDVFLHCAKGLGVSPEECVVVEDSVNGVVAGIRAGMKTVMIPDIFPCPEELRDKVWHCLDTAEPLPSLIAAYNETEA